MADQFDSLAERMPPGTDLRERRLVADLEASGRLGTPIEATAMPFTVPTEDLARAIVSGAPRFATRRRRIEVTSDRLLETARQTWHDLAQQYRHAPDRFERAWRAWIDEQDVTTLNRLIDANNRYYPIEARLPVDIRTGDYITFDGADYRYPVITSAWFLERFPADLTLALSSRAEAD